MKLKWDTLTCPGLPKTLQAMTQNFVFEAEERKKGYTLYIMDRDLDVVDKIPCGTKTEAFDKAQKYETQKGEKDL